MHCSSPAGLCAQVVSFIWLISRDFYPLCLLFVYLWLWASSREWASPFFPLSTGLFYLFLLSLDFLFARCRLFAEFYRVMQKPRTSPITSRGLAFLRMISIEFWRVPKVTFNLGALHNFESLFSCVQNVHGRCLMLVVHHIWIIL